MPDTINWNLDDAALGVVAVEQTAHPNLPRYIALSQSTLKEGVYSNIQKLLNARLQSQTAFDTKYSSLWGLLKDLGTAIAQRDGVMSRSLFDHNMEIYKLFQKMDEILGQWSERKNDDKRMALLSRVDGIVTEGEAQLKEMLESIRGTSKNTSTPSPSNAIGKTILSDYVVKVIEIDMID